MQGTSLSPEDEDVAICLLVTEIVKALVDYGEEVTLDLVQEAGVGTLRLHVAASDVGKVIGKQGRTARSLRIVLGAVGMKLKRRYALDICELGT